MLETGESTRWGESTQHRGEEEGVGGHWVPIEVPAPRCWAGAAIAGHTKQPQSEGQANSPAGSCDELFTQSLLLQAWGLSPEGVWVVNPPYPLLSLELWSKVSE